MRSTLKEIIIILMDQTSWTKEQISIVLSSIETKEEALQILEKVKTLNLKDMSYHKLTSLIEKTLNKA